MLLTQANFSRAIALESVSFRREPFSISSTSAADRRTRIVLFSNNLELLPGETLSTVTAEAEDNLHRVYSLRVEYVGRVPDQPQLAQIILRLSDQMTDNTGDVLLKLTYHGLASNRVRVGIGHLGDGPYVLEFDGSFKAVDYGNFWVDGIDLGHFFWEFWARPGLDASERYLLSDGYGGTHALLLGFSGGAGDGARYVLSGNTWDGTRTISFRSDEGPASNEWGHYAVGWDGTNIITYFNGVPVGRTGFAGPRREYGPAGGGGKLLIGGSDHQNFIGRVLQLRGYEGSNPREDVNGNRASTSAFAPETVFESGGSLLSSFMQSGSLVLDRSGNNHVGRLISTACGDVPECLNQPLPQFVVDRTAPNFQPTQPSELVDLPAQVPPQARVFDSFSRNHSTYAFDNIGGLGSTEGGTAGRQVWQYDQPDNQLLPFGILNGRAVALVNGASAAWISTRSEVANLDIRVDRHENAASAGISTGLVFRYKDLNNFFYTYTVGDTAATQTLTIGYLSDSTPTTLITGLPMPLSWKTLRVVTRETGRIEVYADSTLVSVRYSSVLATEINAGLWCSGNGQSLSNRWDNFTVLYAQ